MNVLETQKTILEKKIMEKARASYDTQLKEARDASVRLLERSKDKSEEDMERAIDAAEEKARSQVVENKSNVELEARLYLLKAKDEIINSVFSIMWEELKNFAKTPRYVNVVCDLIEEGIANLKLDKVIITAGEAERKILTESNIKNIRDRARNILNKEIKIVVDEEILKPYGGVVLSNESGTLVYDNSWQARFERMKKDIYVKVAQTIF